MDANPKKDILIIGAGVAGLSCGSYLNDLSNYNVIVLEGRDRIGGRTWTTNFGGASVDCGASWVHGTKGNPVAELSSKIGLKITLSKEEAAKIQASAAPLKLKDYDWCAWDAAGKTCSYENFAKFEQAFENMFSSLEDLSADLQTPHGLTLPDTTVQEAMMTKATKSGFIKRWSEKMGKEDFERAWEWRITEKESYFNSPLDDMSLRWLADESEREEIGGNRHTINGYCHLVNHLAKGLTIKLDHKVLAITETDKKVVVSTNHGDFTADCVVCSVPLGVLKKGIIKFTPELSAEKREAINSLKMGVLNKVVLEFDQLFWSPVAGWISYISGARDDFSDIKSLFKKTGVPVLVFYLAPRLSAKRQQNGWTEEDMIERCLTILALQFGDLPKKHFVKGMATAWENDPFSYGSYSYLCVGSRGPHYDYLASPEYDHKLLFAGEATNRIRPATVEGAYVSGQREAQRVQSKIK